MLTNEHVIESTVNCFRGGIFGVLDLTEKQLDAMRVLTDETTDELLFGGASRGGKSFLGCEWLLWNCLGYPETRWFIGRKRLTEIRRSTIVTFRKVCKKHNIPQSWWKYDDNAVKITFLNGSVIEGLELMQKPGDPDFDSVGSTEYTGGWIEEAGGVPVKAYEVLKVRIGQHYNDRYGIKGKLYITCNPSKNWLYHTFYLPWKNEILPKFRQFIQSFVADNTKRESGSLERLEKLTGEVRSRLLLGDWDYEDDPLALIQYGAIVDLFTNDYLRADESKKRMVCDVALYGSDLFRIGIFYGGVLVDHVAFPKSGGRQIIAEIKKMQMKHGIPASGIIYDADGVGGFVGGPGGFIPGARVFHGNAAPLNRKADTVSEYGNLKAQCGYLLAERINEGQMWARAVVNEADREMLSEELAEIKKAKSDSDDKLRLRKKEKVVESLGRSPDFADLFLMVQFFEIAEAVKRTRYERPLN